MDEKKPAGDVLVAGGVRYYESGYKFLAGTGSGYAGKFPVSSFVAGFDGNQKGN